MQSRVTNIAPDLGVGARHDKAAYDERVVVQYRKVKRRVKPLVQLVQHIGVRYHFDQPERGLCHPHRYRNMELTVERVKFS